LKKGKKNRTFVGSPFNGLKGNNVDNLRREAPTVQQHRYGKAKRRLII